MAEHVGEVDPGTRRLEAFSDGIFAIAITLLVLDIKVPRLRDTDEGAGLLAALGGQWPAYLAYAISFTTILIMWMNHHSIFAGVRRSDHGLFLLNGLLLLCVGFVPFPTALLAEYLGHTGEQVAMAVYAGTFVVLAVAFNLLWRYRIGAAGLLDHHIDLAFVRGLSRQYLLGPPLYLIAFALAFVHVGASVALCAAVGVGFALPRTFVRFVSHERT